MHNFFLLKINEICSPDLSVFSSILCCPTRRTLLTCKDIQTSSSSLTKLCSNTSGSQLLNQMYLLEEGCTWRRGSATAQLPPPTHSFLFNTGLGRQRLRGFQTRELTNSSERKLPGNSTGETAALLCSSYTRDSLRNKAERDQSLCTTALTCRTIYSGVNLSVSFRISQMKTLMQRLYQCPDHNPLDEEAT